MMFTGIPNIVWVFGYFRASWTLRSDLVADFVCRLLKHMERRMRKKVTVALRPEDQDMPCCPGSIRRISIRATSRAPCTFYQAR